MKKYKLGDICEIVSGSTPKTNITEFWDGDVKWITPAELDENTYIITDSVRKITNLAMQKTGLTAFPAGTVILSSRAPIGKVALAGCKMCCNQGFKNFICSEIVNNKYLYWFLKHNTAYLNSLGRGATFKEISKSIVSSIEIDLPSLEEQKRVVDNIEKISTIITLRKKEISILDDLIKARFVEMFGNGHDGFCNTKKLGEFCKFQQGTQIPVEEQIEEQLEGYTRFLRIIDYTQAPQIPRYVSVKGREIAEDSVVIVRYGATAGFVGHGYAGILANNLFEVVPDESILSKDFLYLALKYGTFEQEVHDKAFGAAMPALSFGMMNDIGVVTPNSTAQNGFVDFVKQVDKSLISLRLRFALPVSDFIESYISWALSELRYVNKYLSRIRLSFIRTNAAA